MIGLKDHSPLADATIALAVVSIAVPPEYNVIVAPDS
jgi:hypothetical protein